GGRRVRRLDVLATRASGRYRFHFWKGSRCMQLKHPVSLWIISLIALSQPLAALAASFTWDGGGANNNWNTAANWNPDGVPVANDSLSFDGVIRTASNNNLPAATQINALSFNATAGAFTLAGNSITLHGDISDNRAVRPETINLNLALDASRSIDVT